MVGYEWLMIFTVACSRGAVVGLCVGVLAGCGLVGEVFGGSGPRTAADLVLPLDAYELPPADRATVQRAQFVLMTACLRQYGIEFKAPDVKAVTYPGSAEFLGWIEGRQVGRYGYVGPPGYASSMAMDGYEPYSVTDDQFRVLAGKVAKFRGKAVPSGGCDATVNGVLNQGAEGVRTNGSVQDEIVTLAGGAAEAAFRDERIAAAERSWSDCMKQAGFRYETASDAMNDPRWQTNVANDQIELPRGTPEEIRTALADSACRRDVNYAGVRQAVYAEYQNKAIEKHRDWLDALKQLNKTQLANATKVLNGQLTIPS